MSIASIAQQISLADVNQTGKVSWLGENGEKSILLNLLGTIGVRGLYYIPAMADGSPNYGAMGAIGSADTKLLLVEKLGLYVFDSNGGNVLPTSVTATGGLWQLIMPSTSQYSQTVANGINAVTITHNLNTATPTVSLFSYPPSGSYPLTQNTDYTLTVADVNTVVLTFANPTSYNSLVIVKR